MIIHSGKKCIFAAALKSRKRLMAVLWSWNRQISVNANKAQIQPIWWAARLCVCRCLPIPKTSRGSPFFMSHSQHNSPNDISKKKFLVFGRVLPIERLCSTHFRKHHIIISPYCAIIILAYSYIISLSYLYLMQLLYLYNYKFWSSHFLQLSCLYNLVL